MRILSKVLGIKQQKQTLAIFIRKRMYWKCVKKAGDPGSENEQVPLEAGWQGPQRAAWLDVVLSPSFQKYGEEQVLSFYFCSTN